MSNHTLSAIGQVAYPTFITARKRNATAKPRWSVTLVYDQSISLEAMKARVAECVLKEYPNGPPGGFRSPFRSGADKRRDDGSMPAGFKETDTFCEFWRYEEHGKVPLVDQFRNELLPSDTYAGMTGRVSFNPFCYSTDGNKGVALGLEAFQKAADGTPVGAAPVDPQAVFDDIGEAPVATPSVADIFK